MMLKQIQLSDCSNVVKNMLRKKDISLDMQRTGGNIKSNLHYTCDITPKRVTSAGVRPRGLAPGQHTSEDTMVRYWRHCETVMRLI